MIPGAYFIFAYLTIRENQRISRVFRVLYVCEWSVWWSPHLVFFTLVMIDNLASISLRTPLLTWRMQMIHLWVTQKENHIPKLCLNHSKKKEKEKKREINKSKQFSIAENSLMIWKVTERNIVLYQITKLTIHLILE